MEEPAGQWEYITEMVYANADDPNIRKFLRERWPEVKSWPKYSVEALIPRLNAFGKNGWELVTLQPVALGEKQDVLMTGDRSFWTECLSCRLQEASEGDQLGAVIVPWMKVEDSSGAPNVEINALRE